ncbi:iron complex outermembrane receptor protein [Pedobacter cryoconitis]|uniref:Iron complex outermembrane receptor protein n=1 Tax=Pedobacter cryoconitis TaxID=188932 RepID=A0A7W9DKP4_9SPHI|nr:TonB-dependent receptor [Pedobacter cryoconitis]MBB5622074.1 iron complex outermembrane receptor protein [Pedobacter cryoconitis]
MKQTLLLFFLLGVLISPNTFAQQRTINGIIYSAEDHLPLPGVSIQIKGLDGVTISAKDGSFKIPVKNGRFLVISYIGYKTREVEIGKSATFNINLEQADNNLNELQIVGSRSANRTKLNSPVPVDIIDLKSLQEYAPQSSVTQLLQYVSPSFHSSVSGGGDAASATSTVQLKGLGVDQVLVLVNGKRRHKSSNISWGGLGNGATGYDLNSIPVGAIERIEILRDGAAAQYGSDAIAGVINIVLKSNVDQLTVSTIGSIRGRGDGLTTRTNANFGVKLGSKGYFNVTGEYATQAVSLPVGKSSDGIYIGPAYGGGANTRGFDQIYTKEIDDAILASRGIDRHFFDQRGSTNKAIDGLLSFNAAIPLKDGFEIYSFGGISHRNSQFTAVYRLPGWTERNNTFVYPDGFLPAMDNIITDQSFAVGVKGKIKEWNVDVSNVYGRNAFDNIITNSLNASLGQKTPRTFNAGSYNASQNSGSIDFTRRFQQVLSGLNVAFGGQYRVETYQIKAGEESSYSKADLSPIYDVQYTTGGIPYFNNIGSTPLNGLSPGSQIHAGFRPGNAVDVKRSISAAYADLELNVTNKWLVSGAFRIENYSDFGSVSTFKAATRYSFAKWLAIRGGYNTGFRAPDLAQFYYTETSTTFQNGVAIDQVTANNVNPATKALGIPALQPERSKGYSAGITSQPLQNIELTLDAYQIDIKDRVGNTGRFSATDTNLPADVRALFVQTGTVQAKFFYNSFSTRTKGIEFTGSYKFLLPDGSGAAFLAGGNFQQTRLTKVNTPKGLEAYRYIIFDESEKARVTSSIPATKITLQGTYNYKKINLLLRTVYFGKVTAVSQLNANFPQPDYYYQDFNPVWITDFSAGYRITPELQATIGVNNLFNVLGDYSIPAPGSNITRTQAPSASQAGTTTGIQPFIRLSATFK